MKKILAMLFVTLLAFSFAACSDDDTTNGGGGSTSMNSYDFTVDLSKMDVTIAKHENDATVVMTTNFRDTGDISVILVGEPTTAVLDEDDNYTQIPGLGWTTGGEPVLMDDNGDGTYSLSVSATKMNDEAWGDADVINCKIMILSNGNWDAITNSLAGGAPEVDGLFAAPGGAGNIAIPVSDLAFDSATAGAVTAGADWAAASFASGDSMPFLTVQASTEEIQVPFALLSQSLNDGDVVNTASSDATVTFGFSQNLAADNSYAITLIETNDTDDGAAIDTSSVTFTASDDQLSFTLPTQGKKTNFVLTVTGSEIVDENGSALSEDITIAFSGAPFTDVTVDVTNGHAALAEKDVCFVGSLNGWNNGDPNTKISLDANGEVTGATISLPEATLSSATNGQEFKLVEFGTWDSPFGGNGTIEDLTGFDASTQKFVVDSTNEACYIDAQ